MADSNDPADWWEDREVVIEIDPDRRMSPVSVGVKRTMGTTSTQSTLGLSWTEARDLSGKLAAFLAEHQ